MKQPKLTALKLPITENDPRIKKNQLYLVKADDQWDVGPFSKQWYGWCFDGCYDAGCDIESIQRIYEFKP